MGRFGRAWVVVAAVVAVAVCLPASTAHPRLRNAVAHPARPAAIASARAVTAAPFGNVLEFDGIDDYASVSDHATLDLGDADGEDFTLEAFLYVPNVASDANQVVFYKQYAYALSINFNPATPDAVVFRWWPAPVGVGDTLLNTADLAAGWHHLAAVFDNEWSDSSDRAAIYLDGSVLASTTAFELTPGIASSAAVLGVGGNLGAASFEGRLDEARLSDSVRYSGSYAVPSAAFSPDASTRALWLFDEAACSTAFADSSGNGNTLAGQNGARTRVPGVAACVADAPTAVSATPGNGEATVGWSAPASDGGSAVIGYVVTPLIGVSSLAPAAVGNVTSTTVSGLTNGTSYTFTVAAVNAAGTGLPSAPSNAVVPAAPPGAPTNAKAVAGNGEATVTFAAPFDGGAPISSYTVTATPGGQTATTSGSRVAYVCGLANGTSYTFRVTATNAIGEGPPSQPSAPVTPEGGGRADPAPPGETFPRPAVPIPPQGGTRVPPPGHH